MTPFGPGNRQRLLGVGLLVVTFVAGAFAGATYQVVAARSPAQALEARRDRDPRHDPRAGAPPDFPYRELGLSEEQQVQVEAVLRRRSEEMDAFWHEEGPRMRAIVDSARAEIRSILTADQRRQMDEMRAKRRQLSREREERERGQGRNGK
jgi:Spy/CpxP family protein refolding chaperone